MGGNIEMILKEKIFFYYLFYFFYIYFTTIFNDRAWIIMQS